MIKFEPPPERGLWAWLRRYSHFFRLECRAEIEAWDKQMRRDISRALLRAGYIRDPVARAEIEEKLDQAEDKARDKQ